MSNVPPYIRNTLVILVFALTGLSLFFSFTVTSLYKHLEKDESAIQALKNQLTEQKIIIDRFNNSVTNSDVEKHVLELEKSLHQTEDDMKHSLDETTLSIQVLLNHTVDRLNQTVKIAQAEIDNEVRVVKSDFQQYVRTTQDQFSMENSFMKFQLAGTFCLLAILISMWHMTAHIRKFNRPFVQRKILAILWMSPIYAVTSWLSLVFPKFEAILAIIKDFYEAYVIYQFLGFCISVLGKGERDKVVDLLADHGDHLDQPIRWCGWFRRGSNLHGRALASAVLMQCQAFAMQFVFFQPLTSVGLFTCRRTDLCTIPDIPEVDQVVLFGILPLHTLQNPILWLRIIQNISVFMAFSGLLKFYHAVQNELAWCNPFPKFLCIKGIVFMTFWQGLVISLLAETTETESPIVTTDNHDGDHFDDPDLWAKQAQNFLICLEMLLFSIAHFYCFPTDEWQDGYQPVMERKVKGLDNMAFGDFVEDLKLIMRGNAAIEKTKKKPKKKDGNNGPTINNDKDNRDDDDGGGGGGNTSATKNEKPVVSDVEEGVIHSETQESNDRDNGNTKNDDDNSTDLNLREKINIEEVEEARASFESDKNSNDDDDNDDNNDLVLVSENDSDNEDNSNLKDGNVDGDNDNDKKQAPDDIRDGKDDVDNENNISHDSSDNSNNNDSGKNTNDESLDQGFSDHDSISAEEMDFFLTKSMREALASHSPTIREAAHRLLRDQVSDQVSGKSDIHCESQRSRSFSESEINSSSNQSSPSRIPFNSTYGAVNAANSIVSEYNSMAPMGGDSTQDLTAGETTSLLGNSNNNDRRGYGDDTQTSEETSTFATTGSSMGAMNNFG